MAVTWHAIVSLTHGDCKGGSLCCSMPLLSLSLFFFSAHSCIFHISLFLIIDLIGQPRGFMLCAFDVYSKYENT